MATEASYLFTCLRLSRFQSALVGLQHRDRLPAAETCTQALFLVWELRVEVSIREPVQQEYSQAKDEAQNQEAYRSSSNGVVGRRVHIPPNDHIWFIPNVMAFDLAIWHISEVFHEVDLALLRVLHDIE